MNAAVPEVRAAAVFLSRLPACLVLAQIAAAAAAAADPAAIVEQGAAGGGGGARGDGAVDGAGARRGGRKRAAVASAPELVREPVRPHVTGRVIKRRLSNE